MVAGPLELMILAFPGNRFTGEITPALKELVDNGTIRIVDLTVIAKDAAGRTRAVEAGDPLLETVPGFADLLGDLEPTFTDEDLDAFGEMLEPNSTGAFFLFDNVWETRLMNAVRDADGRVLLNQHLPHAVCEALAALSE